MRRTCHRRGTCAAFLLNNELGLFLSKLFPKHKKSKKSLVLELLVEFYIKQKSVFYLCNKVYDLTPTEPKFAPNTNSLNKPARSGAEQNV